MGFSRVFLVCLIFSLLAALTVHSHPTTVNCARACAGRCRLSSRPNLCKRACGTCCSRCNCVPPGTAGNREVCPCYARMTTRGGRPKCP
ncbi:unnamed protein product [Spirodela intermedia]|uniref:Uncharacterized protein n=1 Tax=Spirodela intermedia TaxID=51605 RepID=A0A7I8KJK8_SPIIN|nr:unnamed protein product [Spirodela intermedia]